MVSFLGSTKYSAVTHAVASGTWLPNTRALNWHSNDTRILLTIETDGVTPYTIQTQRLLLATGLHNTVRCNNRTEHLSQLDQSDRQTTV